MKKLSLLVLMLIGITGFAQQHEGMNRENRDKMTAEEKADMMTDRLTKQLDLTAEQKVKVRELYLERAKKQQERMATRQEKMKDAKEKMKDRREKNREQMMADRQENMERLKTILTEEQFKKFQQMQKERQAKMRKGSRDWDDKNDSN
ncbi:MAG: hypothetical protein WCD31_08510 [Gillisia sp.]